MRYAAKSVIACGNPQISMHLGVWMVKCACGWTTGHCRSYDQAEMEWGVHFLIPPRWSKRMYR